METWYAKPTGCGGQALIISEADGRDVAVVYEEKDAPLLAAAPELLNALKRLLSANEADYQYVPTAQIQFAYQTNGQALRAAREAIAKAEGR